MFEYFLPSVMEAARAKLLFLPHAIKQMTRGQDPIETKEVSNVIFKGEIIEDYPEDPRGHSCLMLGFGRSNRAIHVVCSPKKEYLPIITAYIPSKTLWSDDFKRRIDK